MENQILVPLDNTEINEDIIKLTDEYGHDIQVKIFFLHVINPEYTWSEEKVPLFEDCFEKVISRFEIKCDYEVMLHVGKPYDKIIEVENTLHPQMILMAAHSHTVLHRLFWAATLIMFCIKPQYRYTFIRRQIRI